MKLTKEEWLDLNKRFTKINREYFEVTSCCAICGKSFFDITGMSGQVSSMEYPGLYNHFPNCPK
ncbi:MAG TPA: hypothetical protein VI432_00120 [Candidatus Paceibacterota bacterium]